MGLLQCELWPSAQCLRGGLKQGRWWHLPRPPSTACTATVAVIKKKKCLVGLSLSHSSFFLQQLHSSLAQRIWVVALCFCREATVPPGFLSRAHRSLWKKLSVWGWCCTWRKTNMVILMKHALAFSSPDQNKWLCRCFTFTFCHLPSLMWDAGTILKGDSSTQGHTWVTCGVTCLPPASCLLVLQL